MEKENSYNPSFRWSDKTTAEKESNGTDEAQFFSLLRQPTDRVDYLCFTLKNGRQHTLSASDVTEMFHHPDTGIVLFFNAGIVRIEGRNLETLFDYMQERRVKEVKEFSDIRETLFNANALFVERIVFESENLSRAGV